MKVLPTESSPTVGLESEMKNEVHVFQTLSSLIRTLVEVDLKIQEIITSKGPMAQPDIMALETFENTLLKNPELLNSSFLQFLDCFPLVEQRKAICTKIEEFGGNCDHLTVSQIREVNEAIIRKEEVENIIKTSLRQIEPSLEEVDLIDIGSLGSTISLNSEVLDKMPQYKNLIPLAEEKTQIDLKILNFGIFPVSKEESTSQQISTNNGITYQKNWWGISVDVNHEKFLSIVNSTNYATMMTGALGTFLSGPAGIVATVCGAFFKVYGTALRTIEKGNGIRFYIPWVAIYPFANPLFIVPFPL